MAYLFWKHRVWRHGCYLDTLCVGDDDDDDDPDDDQDEEEEEAQE